MFGSSRQRWRGRAFAAVPVGLVAALASCGGGVGTAGAPAGTVAAAPDNTMPGTVSTCVRPRHRTLRAFAFGGRELPLRIVAGREPRCPSGTLRILRIQELRVAGGASLVRRGGCDRPGPRERCRPQATVQLLVSDLQPVRRYPARRNGNGAARAPCGHEAGVDPRAVGRELDQMFYKTPAELPGRSVSGARWSNYGDPGRRFGALSLTYLLWNLPRTTNGVLPGGGIVEAVLVEHQRVALCAVPTVSLPSFDRLGRRNGRVTFAYVRVTDGHQTVYGWVLQGYAHHGRPRVQAMRPVA